MQGLLLISDELWFLTQGSTLVWSDLAKDKRTLKEEWGGDIRGGWQSAVQNSEICIYYSGDTWNEPEWYEPGMSGLTSWCHYLMIVIFLVSCEKWHQCLLVAPAVLKARSAFFFGVCWKNWLVWDLQEKKKQTTLADATKVSGLRANCQNPSNLNIF